MAQGTDGEGNDKLARSWDGRGNGWLGFDLREETAAVGELRRYRMSHQLEQMRAYCLVGKLSDVFLIQEVQHVLIGVLKKRQWESAVQDPSGGVNRGWSRLELRVKADA